MSIENIRRIKEAAGQPSERKQYVIPKVSEKRKKQIEADKVMAKQDKEFYAEVWAASPHVCQNCDCKLGKEPLTIYFHHLLPKAKYPQFRHTPENIMILCGDCHSQAETDLDKVMRVKVRTREADRILLSDN